MKNLEVASFADMRWDERGLVPAVVQDAATGQVLMVAWMNAEALRLTLATGETHFWSRSRGELWHKGATSGLVQIVREMRIDDDQDTVWLRVDVPGGASCHVGYRSCFYRAVPGGDAAKTGITLAFTETEKVVDPQRVYGDAPNPTRI